MTLHVRVTLAVLWVFILFKQKWIEKMMKELIKKIVNENPGINGVKLATSVLESFYKEKRDWTQDDYFKNLEELISQKEIVEIEYVLPELENMVKSIYFPKGTDVRLVKIS